MSSTWKAKTAAPISRLFTCPSGAGLRKPLVALAGARALMGAACDVKQ